MRQYIGAIAAVSRQSHYPRYMHQAADAFFRLARINVLLYKSGFDKAYTPLRLAMHEAEAIERAMLAMLARREAEIIAALQR